MPSVSKNQQKFMGIVRSIQKGEQPAGKFSKDAQKAAKKMKKSSVKKYAKTKHDDLPIKKEERDYKDEYKKFQSSTKAKKYRAELNKYNRQKGTYGNGDGKDASHKGGKIVGFESQSKNRGRAEKSRLKKEAKTTSIEAEELMNFLMKRFKFNKKKAIDTMKKAGFNTSMLKKEDIRQEIEEYVDGILDGMGEEFMVNEEKECMCEACQKGYMTHPTRKTKVMFGKRYRNCVKKEGKVDERKFNHKKVGDHYMGGENTPKGDTEMFADKKGRYYVWVKPKGKKARYIDLPKNVKDRSKADDLHRKIAKTMGESIDEGKYSKIMKAVRKGPKSGPWQIIVSKNNKVVKEVPVKTLQLIPAHYDDIKKAYPNHKIGIEAKDGKIVYREWVVNIKEGTCGYGIDGQLGSEPAGPHLLKKKKKKKDEASLGGRMSKKISKHKGTRNSADAKKVEKLLLKYGNTKKDVADMMKKYDYVSKTYRRATPAKKAEILSSLRESVNEAKYKGYDYKRQNRKGGLSLIVPALRKTFANMKDLKKYIDKHGKMESVKLKGKSGMGTISHVGMPPASKGVEKLFKIADGGFGKVGGQTVDSMSANLFKQIYDKASDDIKLKLNKKNEKQLVMIISKMWDKFGKNVSIGSSI